MLNFKHLLFSNGRNIQRIATVLFLDRTAKMNTLTFDNTVLKALPLDKVTGKGVRTVPGACYSLVETTPVENPELVVHSQSALALLGISESDVAEKDFVEYFSGNKLFPGSESAAHCYCGHQFGYFSGQLGDGAAM